MSALATTQAAMHDWLRHGDPAIAARVEGPLVAHRLRIHADAYRLRLIEVLANDYPVTAALLDEDRFDDAALGYLQAHPSTHPSLRHFGRGFAGWLQQAPAMPRHLHELARFEWLQGEVFDAADAAPLTLDAIASLPAGAWPSLRLHLQPAVRFITLASNAPALVEAHAQGRRLPALRRVPGAHWLLWRVDGDAHWRRLDADEAALLQAVFAGETFGDLCERATDFHAHDGPLRAASVLKRWLADGLLAIDPPAPTHD
ncbi:MAG TPA: DNA-binding domain-containing protein [Thermomonas sp.]|jgi:hypothetical protein|nr:DNA-binding domain-containing protein [Thermomonas sp.]HOZ23172.1 DNA-binding domain-containing protein [Thermomonas sp.]HPW13251.1 DNA-binding domain-containing protein [Thermomonas sp.]